MSNPYAALPDDAWAEPAAQAPDPEEKAPPVNRYTDVGAFVDELIRPTYRRFLGGSHYWCADWYLHPEALAYLVAIWRAYEHLLREDEWTGSALWIRDHLYPCLDRLMNPNGPFRLCKDKHSDDLEQLPGSQWEPGLFDNL